MGLPQIAQLPVGASCLPSLAAHLRAPLAANERIIDAAAPADRHYVLVHMYLVPGDAQDARRQDLRHALHRELQRLGAIGLHDVSYAVPTTAHAGRATAEHVWNALIVAGALGRPDADPDAWMTGDVVYVHYIDDNGLAVIAARPESNERLPQIAP